MDSALLETYEKRSKQVGVFGSLQLLCFKSNYIIHSTSPTKSSCLSHHVMHFKSECGALSYVSCQEGGYSR